jgi:GH24 family phage-related lysozyme (muramidase)
VNSGRDRGTSPTRVNGISENGIKFIAEKEGFVGKAHWDNSQYSIGYGTRTDDPEEIAGRKTVTKEEAMRRLKEHVEKKIRPTLDPLAQKYGWNQSQYDAMASFAYNLGAGALTQVTAGGTRTNEQISSAMLQYNKERKGGSPVVSDGLTIRRRQEQTLFASNEPSTPITSPVDSRFRTASVPSPVSSIPDRPLTTNTPENTLISGVTGMMASVFSAMGDMTRSVQQIASAPTARSSEQSTPIPSPYDSQLFESLLMHHSSLGSSISGS